MASNKPQMTPEERGQRHIELHRAFDELLADWLAHDPYSHFLDDRRRSIHSPISELMNWSHQQTIEPEK
jgi:hypothetical protein